MIYGRHPIGTIGIMNGIPSLPTPFVWSFIQMMQYNMDYVCNPNEKMHYVQASCSFHAAARNSLVNQMKGDWLLQLDTDITFEPDLVTRMLRIFFKYDLDVLAGIYVHKSHPYPPNIYKWVKDKNQFEMLVDWDRPKGEYFIPVASSGAGALLVHRRVFERIKNELKSGAFDIISPFGEDHSFFCRLKELGIQAYAHPEIQVNHLKWQELNMDNYDLSAMGPLNRELVGSGCNGNK